MSTQRQGRRISWLVIVGLMVGACILVYTLLPGPTTLVITVVDAETGGPLAGAEVWVQAGDGQPLATVTTDASGAARFEEPAPGPAYTVRVQKVDYDLAVVSQVPVPAEEETAITVPLAPHPGERLYVGLEGGELALVDTASLLAVRIVALPGTVTQPIDRLLLHPEKDLLYLIAGENGHILDSQSLAMLGQLALVTADGDRDPVSAWGLSDDGQRLYVIGPGYRGPLLILDAHTGELLNDVPLHDPGVPPAIFVAPSSHGGRLYALQFGEERVVVETLDAVLEEVLAGLPLGLLEGAVLSADRRYLYDWLSPLQLQSENRPREQLHIRQLDVKPTVLTTRSLPPGTSDLVPAPAKLELYLLNMSLGTLTILDPTEETPPTLIPVGKEPDAVVVSGDGTWAYVANRGSRTLSVVHLPSARVVHTIPLQGVPISLAVW